MFLRCEAASVAVTATASAAIAATTVAIAAGIATGLWYVGGVCSPTGIQVYMVYIGVYEGYTAVYKEAFGARLVVCRGI